MAIFDDWDEPLENKVYTKRIGVGKFGLSADFAAVQSLESSKKGMFEMYDFLILRGENEPDTEFVWITPSNYWRLKPADRIAFPPNVTIVDFKDVRNLDDADRILAVSDQYKLNELNELFVFAGPTSHAAGGVVPGILSNKGTELKSLQMFHKYCSGILKFINNTTMPWYHIMTDNRYHLNMLDLIRLPAKAYGYGTKNYHYFFKHCHDITKPNDFVADRVDVDMTDYHMISLFKKDKVDYSKLDKSVDLIVVANQIKGNGDERFEMIKEYVLDNKVDCKIVGKWEADEYINAFGDLLLNKNGLTRDELFEYTHKVKYALIFNYDQIKVSSQLNPHIKSDRIGWIVTKIYETLYSGIVPIFIEMDQFDQNLPKQLFVNSPKELKESLEWLKQNPVDLSHYITDEKLNGKYFYRNGKFEL